MCEITTLRHCKDNSSASRGDLDYLLKNWELLDRDRSERETSPYHAHPTGRGVIVCVRQGISVLAWELYIQCYIHTTRHRTKHQRTDRLLLVLSFYISSSAKARFRNRGRRNGQHRIAYRGLSSHCEMLRWGCSGWYGSGRYHGSLNGLWGFEAG